MVVRPFRLCRRAKVTIGITLAFSFAFAFAAPSEAGAGRTAWRFDWRPNWLPGDPVASTAAPRAQRRSESGLRVAIDPETGRPVRPSAAQRRAASEEFDRSESRLAPDAPLAADRLRGGGEVVHLQGKFQMFSVARRDPSGRIVTDCGDDAARTTPRPAPRPREVK